MLRRLVTLIGVVGLAMGSLSGFASAGHLIIEVGGPDEAVIGEEIEITATVRDSETGEPVHGAVVVFYGDASFIGVTGDIELGRVASNEIGVATYITDFTVSRNHTIRAEIADDPDVAPAAVSINIAIGSQLISTEPIVELPAVGGWVVRLVMGGVWAVMIVAALWIVRVSRSARPSVADDEEVTRADLRMPLRGGVNWAVIVATAMMALGSGILVLLIRSPNTRANINPEGYSRSAIAYLDAAYFYPGVGLSTDALTGDQVADGRILYVSKGCAGCHGLNAQGTAAASSPAFATRQWLGSIVRSGQPGGMPSFDETDITEAELDDMHTFLLDAREALVNPASQDLVQDDQTAAGDGQTSSDAGAESIAPEATIAATPPSGKEVSFAADVAPIFEANCAACHGEAGGWNATDFESVMTDGNSGATVVPGDASASVLVQRITAAGASGPLMPPGGSLAESDIATIVDWIDGGAAP